jgi:glycosyltransferase involved in cell wall biosynthesis
MPTRNRREFFQSAVDGFLAQDWPNKELIVIDDGYDRVGDLIPPGGHVRYYHLQDRRTIGQKRNIACSRANGEIILHWDDDDWYAPGRMSDQVMRHVESGAVVGGYHTIYFADDELGRAWQYRGGQQYAVGASLCYRREYWMTHPFIDVDRGEDNTFLCHASSVASADGRQMLVARVHGGNTCDRRRMLTKGKDCGGPMDTWSEVDYSILAGLGYPAVGATVAA